MAQLPELSNELLKILREDERAKGHKPSYKVARYSAPFILAEYTVWLHLEVGATYLLLAQDTWSKAWTTRDTPDGPVVNVGNLCVHHSCFMEQEQCLPNASLNEVKEVFLGFKRPHGKAWCTGPSIGPIDLDGP